MMKIKMLKDSKGSDDGKFTQDYQEGITYIVGNDLGKSFCEQHLAECLEEKIDAAGEPMLVEEKKEGELDKDAVYVTQKGKVMKLEEEKKDEEIKVEEHKKMKHEHDNKSLDEHDYDNKAKKKGDK